MHILPQAIFVSDWLISKKIFFSGTTLPNKSKLGRKHPWKVIYKECAFSSHQLINMATTGHSCLF
jgi:ribonuclease BN (tRNA processing enzyme)